MLSFSKDTNPLAPTATLVPSVQAESSVVERTKLPEETALDHFRAEGVGGAVDACGWTIYRDMLMLQKIADDPLQPAKIRILASDAIRRRMLDSLRLSGRIVELTARRTTTDDGVTPEDDDAVSIVREVQATTQQLLESSRDLRTVVDAPREQVLNEARDTRVPSGDGV